MSIRPKIKFYLFGIAARPTEKLATQIILFAFQTIFFLIGIVPEFRSCTRSLFGALFISNLDHKSAWCTLYWEQTFKRHRIENGLLKRKKCRRGRQWEASPYAAMHQLRWMNIWSKIRSSVILWTKHGRTSWKTF